MEQVDRMNRNDSNHRKNLSLQHNLGRPVILPLYLKGRKGNLAIISLFYKTSI